MTMIKRLLDPLYGPIAYSARDKIALELYQTRTMARLRDISLSSVPSRMQPAGQASSRFEHSVGVAYLASVLCERDDFTPFRNELIVAALLHDSASVPFSHTAEAFQYALTGRTHEQNVVSVIDGRTDVGRIMRRHNVSAENVLALINGQHPYLDGILASTFDIDSADNSLRLFAALGGLGTDRRLPYSPVRLMEAFVIKNDEVGLDSNYLTELLGWSDTRRRLYGEVLYHDQNLAAACMLYRALEGAFDAGVLTEEFFGWGESDALSWLVSNDVPAPSRRLIDAALRWQFYKRVYEHRTLTYSGKIMTLSSNWQERKAFADELAKTLGVKPEHVVIAAGKDKGVKTIHYPFVGEQADACAALFQDRPRHQHLSIFVSPDQAVTRAVAAAAVAEILVDVPESEPGHVFF